ncbi:hypothetical protein BD410DRAFT_807099 [Rickenella mellea]|uniref:Pre-mRNA-splicing factor RSE1 n=1 Tax=Rickenella mellea TaxID=50990 RepID=A0A4Y7PQM5_9AGAM|nr:hypothetical protein BD410DRAFT_807099 [Rickenella mellea]
MHLYNLTLQRAAATVKAIVGNFSGTKQQEIIVSHGTSLELLTIASQTGKLSTVTAKDVFGSIRSIVTFRLTGGTKDFVIIGSDSGHIVVLEYEPNTMSFTKVHQEPFGKSGARRTVPGQYLATDPSGRSVMIAAMEKAKLVYILNRDAADNLSISSPLEAHRNAAIIHDIVGVDVGFENPLYAALEVDYTEPDQDPSGVAFRNAEKVTLTFYELDLGLNHVVRKWSQATDPRANLLVQVPGGRSNSGDRMEGPSDHIIYWNMDALPHRVPIPRRKGIFFTLLQSEEGDLYKVTIDYQEEDVRAVKIKYFDTVPAATSLCVLKSGFLFVASEFGNQYLYQFQKLGDDDDEVEISSSSYPKFGMLDPSTPLPRVHINPKPLDNLVLVDHIESLCPIIDSHVLNVSPTSDTPRIFMACGRGGRSTLRMLRHGLEVEEIASSELPGIPSGVWTTRLKAEDSFHSLIVLSFLNSTRVLTVGDSIEEAPDGGFLTTQPTLAVEQIGTDALIQVHPFGIRHVLSDLRVNEWNAPRGTTIVFATTNQRQVVAALSSAELVYFELDPAGQLNEYQEKAAMGSTVVALSVPEIPIGQLRSKYLAVGCEDQTVRIVSLDPDNTLETTSLQALTSPPSSLCIAEIMDASVDKHRPTTFVSVGLRNGVLLRSVLDPVSGQLTGTRTRFLGSRMVRMARIRVNNHTSILALSSRIWVNYVYQNSMHFTSLLCDNFDYASSFSTALCPEGIIGVSGTTIRIFTIPKLGTKLKQTSMQLSYTPRKITLHPDNKYFYMIEADHRVTRDQGPINEMSGEGTTAEPHLKVFGQPKAPQGSWVSCIRIVDPIVLKSIREIYLDNNEAAFSMSVVPFTASSGESYLVVGTASDTGLAPRSCTNGFLRTYRFTEGGCNLDLVHKTTLDDIPLVTIAFQGRLLVGVGKSLCLYDMGKQRLLRKTENKFPSAISTLNTEGSRIIVGDSQESIFLVSFKAPENQLVIIANNTSARWVTAAAMTDYCTVAAGDKFGNIFINRLDKDVSDQADNDPTGASIMHGIPRLMGAPHKTRLMAHFHVGDIVTSIHKVFLVSGGHDVLLYTGIHGTIGALVPVTSKDDIGFLSTLEQHMRSERTSLIGRDHLSWRGYHAPVKAVIDGDLCETFSTLPNARQATIAEDLDRTVEEILKKLEQLRTVSTGF